MTKTVYKSGIDWWVWVIMLSMLVLAIIVIVDAGWYVAIPLCGVVMSFVLLIPGCKYEIDGGELIVYQFFRPHRFPISKISEVRKTTGYLATAGMSSKRVSISFSDRSVMKSYMPLELSPADRDSFIAALRHINPAINAAD